MPSVDKSRHGFSGLNPRCRAQSPAASSALLSAGSSPEKLQVDLSSEKNGGLARPQDTGGLPPAKDENADSVHFGRRKAYLSLSTDGKAF